MLHKLGCFVIALGLAMPAWCVERAATISGFVHNAEGVPQMGAAVEVLGSAFDTFRVFTDEKGFFRASGLIPGVYSIKVSAPSFLPTLREKIGLKAGAGVLLNLTLSTIFDAIQFAPRREGTDDGDWDWVLRSASNRPVLRVLPDGSPVMLAKDTKSNRDLKGTLSFVAGAPADGFGAISDMSTGFQVEKSLFSSGTLTFNGNVGYGASSPNAIVRTSFKHQIANGSTPEIAFTMRRLGSPLDGEHNAELQSLAMSMADNISLGDVLELNRKGDPTLTGIGAFASINGEALPDIYSGTFTYQGRDIQTHSMRLVLEQKLNSDVTATVDYSYGSVLNLKDGHNNFGDVRNQSVTRNRHSISAKLAGTTPGTRTRWIASYGWTSGRALTPVDMF